MPIVNRTAVTTTDKPIYRCCGAKAKSAFALYISWRNVTKQKLIKPLSARLCRHRAGSDKSFMLVPLEMTFYCATKHAYAVQHTMRLSKLKDSKQLPKIQKQ